MTSLSRPPLAQTVQAKPLSGCGIGFAERLRESTKDVHREAERCGFIADLLHGRSNRRGYALFLRNLEPAYAALERGLDALVPSGVRILSAFADPGLRRLPALRRDIEAIAGEGWRSLCPLLPQARAYAGAIEQVAKQGDGTRLAAHAYARYFGDLSGGQILHRLLSRTLGLGPEALSFYEFSAYADLDAPKKALREALDVVPPTGSEADAFIAEAISAFRHNIAVSTAVGEAVATTVDT